MNARPLRLAAVAALVAGFVVLVLASADLVHLLHASLLLALGVGVLLSSPRTG